MNQQNENLVLLFHVPSNHVQNTTVPNNTHITNLFSPKWRQSISPYDEYYFLERNAVQPSRYLPKFGVARYHQLYPILFGVTSIKTTNFKLLGKGKQWRRNIAEF